MQGFMHNDQRRGSWPVCSVAAWVLLTFLDILEQLRLLALAQGLAPQGLTVGLFGAITK